MEENEEIIKQEELEASGPDGLEARREQLPQDKEEEEEKESSSLVHKNNKEPMASKSPKSRGILLTVFSAVVLILIGGLAFYYYYTFQRQGMASEKVLTNVWDETVLTTVELTQKFDTIDAFNKLDDPDKESFATIVNDSNRTIRDGIFDIRSQSGMDINTSTFASKLNGFLDDYSSMLTELKRIVARVEEVKNVSELDQLMVYQENMEKSYDELLLVSGSFIQANLSRTIFDMPADIKALLQKQLDEEGTQDEQDKVARQAAEQVVNKFVQAWQSRDSDGMTDYLTPGARGEFNPGILEESSDIMNFRILDTTLAEDGSNITIGGRLEKRTPDNATVSESWKFVLLKSQDEWLIDSWDKQS